MKGKILYLLLLAATVFWGILYYSSALISLAVLELLAAAASFLLLQIQAGKLRGKIYLPLSVTEKGERMEAGLELENRSLLPVTRAEAVLYCRNTLYPETQRISLGGMADGKSRTRILKYFSGEHCGPVELAVEEIRIWDFLRIFKRKVKLSAGERWVILPRMYRAMILLEETTRNALADSEEYDRDRPGDDVSEVFQLREYRPGDRIQSVHWKRSAAGEDLIVREYSLPVGNAVVLFLDMRWREGYLDDFLEAGLAISGGLLEAGCRHYAAWMDSSGDVSRMGMSQQEDLYALTEALFRAGTHSRSGELEELYREKYRGESCSCSLRLDTDMRFWKNGELLRDLSENPRVILESGELLI